MALSTMTFLNIDPIADYIPSLWCCWEEAGHNDSIFNQRIAQVKPLSNGGKKLNSIDRHHEKKYVPSFWLLILSLIQLIPNKLFK